MSFDLLSNSGAPFPGIGIMAALRETDLVRFDFQVSYIVEERRLKEKEELILEELMVTGFHWC